MDDLDNEESIFPGASEGVAFARKSRIDNPSYRLAYADEPFLLRDELRAVRLQLEWLKPDLIQQKNQIESTVVVFGGARFPAPDELDPLGVKGVEKSLPGTAMVTPRHSLLRTIFVKIVAIILRPASLPKNEWLNYRCKMRVSASWWWQAVDRA